jgi:hypothetical protein
LEKLSFAENAHSVPSSLVTPSTKASLNPISGGILSHTLTNINYVVELENVTVTNGMFSFTWDSLPGFVFQVQYKTNLNQPNWINLGSTITASNTVVSATNPIGSDKQRFYRVQQQ